MVQTLPALLTVAVLAAGFFIGRWRNSRVVVVIGATTVILLSIVAAVLIVAVVDALGTASRHGLLEFYEEFAVVCLVAMVIGPLILGPLVIAAAFGLGLTVGAAAAPRPAARELASSPADPPRGNPPRLDDAPRQTTVPTAATMVAGVGVQDLVTAHDRMQRERARAGRL
jgi:hypothetical protein